MSHCEYFKDKKITVMGLGLLGRGIGDAAFLAECGADLIVTDLKPEDQLVDSIKNLSEVSNRLDRRASIKYTLGEHKNEDFENVDMVLVAAGVPLDSPYLEHARKAGVRLVQSAALFAELSKIPIIGVTGTRGKSTVTAMIHHVLSVITGEHIIKGGNVRGVSNLQLLKEVKEDSLAVFELDSWQLQGFGWSEISPQIAVFTNFMPDHLNYYQAGGVSKEEAMKRYFADKANIFINQDEDGVLITTPEVFEQAKITASTRSDLVIKGEVVLVDDSVLPEDMLLSMPGAHNRMNAALAYEALKATGLTEEEIFEGLASFPGMEGRLQLLTEIDGVKVYNDNNATTPIATANGLEAVADGQNVVLIVGGTDKGLDVEPLVDGIRKHAAHVILYGGTGTEQLKAKLSAEVSYEEHGSLAECMEAALATATRDNVILFSPGFASFGTEFKNEYDRNDQFVELVKKYEDQ